MFDGKANHAWDKRQTTTKREPNCLVILSYLSSPTISWFITQHVVYLQYWFQNTIIPLAFVNCFYILKLITLLYNSTCTNVNKPLSKSTQTPSQFSIQKVYTKFKIRLIV